MQKSDLPVSIDYIIRAERRRRSLEVHELRKNTPDEGKDKTDEKETEKENSCKSGDLPLFFTNGRHSKEPVDFSINPCWRGSKKDKIKSVGVALVLCLNIGVNPPGAGTTSVDKHLECWINLNLHQPEKGVEAVGKKLQSQYERYLPRTRFRHGLDPTLEDVKKICTTLRQHANTDRLLFHYNGHGVPAPTQNGEIWVFDRKYTNYVPLSLHDVLTWTSGPTIFVYDCNSAGLIVEKMEKFRMKRVADYEHRKLVKPDANLPPTSRVNDVIQLGACGRNQQLPMGFDVPADLFTCCLTTPVKAALHWYVSKQSTLLPHITSAMLDEIPGDSKDRHSPLGELNWIFVAITDTIAWMILRDDPDTFQRFFREDLLVAGLMRNYLLAERVMNSFGVNTVTSPELPASWNHPMWDLWDWVVDQCVGQLPEIIDDGSKYVKSSFFTDQLTALKLWLDSSLPRTQPPDQLPILLQVLLNLDYRNQAVLLLDRVLNLGHWSVKLVLQAGYFPILLQLLRSHAVDILHPTMVLIWAKIMGHDRTCGVELVKQDCHKYFIDVVQNYSLPPRYVTSAAYVLANIMFEYPDGQKACFHEHLVSICLDRLHSSHSLLRQWCAICLAMLWTNYDAARGCGIRDGAAEKLSVLLSDPSPEVRASAVFALGKLIANRVEVTTDDLIVTVNRSTAEKLTSKPDGSPLVRKEVIVALYGMIIQSENAFMTSITAVHDVYRRRLSSIGDQSEMEMATLHDVYRRRLSSVGNQSEMDTTTLHDVYRRRLSSVGNQSEMDTTTLHDVYRRRLSSVVDQHDSEMFQVERRESRPRRDSIRRDSRTRRDSLLSEDVFGLSVRKSSETTKLACRCESHHGSVCQFLKSRSSTTAASVPNNIYTKIYQLMVHFAGDPDFDIREMASNIVSYLNARFFDRTSLPPKLNRRRVRITSICEEGMNKEEEGEDEPEQEIPCARGAFKRCRYVSEPSSSSRAYSLPPPSAFAKSTKEEPTSVVHNNTSTSEVEDTYSKNAIHKQVIATTNFFEWCKNEFLAVSLKKRLNTSSLEFETREWRSLRNCKVRVDSERQIRSNPILHLEEEVFMKKNVHCPAIVQFDPFLPQVVVADRQGVCVWDYESKCKLNYFLNGNAKELRICSMHIVNSHEVPLLLIGSDEGDIRVWKHYDDEPQLELVSAWNVIPVDLTIDKSLALVTEWQQSSGTLLASGKVDFVRIWDAEKEVKLMDIPIKCAKSNQPAVTCLKGNSPNNKSVFVAGLGDGGLQIIDSRLPPAESCVMQLREHLDWIANVFVREEHDESIVSASTNGDIKFWDVRMTSSIFTIKETQSYLPAVDMHAHADLIACGSLGNGVKVINCKGEVLSQLLYHDGIIGQKVGPVCCLSFHPYWTHLAVGTSDSVICAYSQQKLAPLVEDMICSEYVSID